MKTIIDETEQTRTIVVNHRAYTVPKDVADSHDALLDALRRIRNNASARFWNSEASSVDLDAYRAIMDTAQECLRNEKATP